MCVYIYILKNPDLVYSNPCSRPVTKACMATIVVSCLPMILPEKEENLCGGCVHSHLPRPPHRQEVLEPVDTFCPFSDIYWSRSSSMKNNLPFCLTFILSSFPFSVPIFLFPINQIRKSGRGQAHVHVLPGTAYFRLLLRVVGAHPMPPVHPDVYPGGHKC